jgi:polyphenol oxidase
VALQAQIPLPSGLLRVVFTDRADGDFQVDRPQDELETLRTGWMPAPWTWLRQVHGAEVVTVHRPGEGAGTSADAAVTAIAGCPLAVTTADCAPVVLVAEAGFAVVHAGWRGLVAGVVANAAAVLAPLGGRPVTSLVGPCINPTVYEFGAEDLDEAVAALGPEVRSRTASGSPALDMPRAVDLACQRAGWPPPTASPDCTSGLRYFSHRTRADTGRQTAVAWLEPGPAPGRG